MGRVCSICSYEKPNEKFGGKGIRSQVCKDCRSKGKEYVVNHLALEEIYSYWSQKNISKKNISKLKNFSDSNDPEVSKLASTVLEITLIYPHRKNRFRNVSLNHINLFEKGVELNLFYPYEKVETEEEYLEKYRKSLESVNHEVQSTYIEETEDEMPF